MDDGSVAISNLSLTSKEFLQTILRCKVGAKSVRRTAYDRKPEQEREWLEWYKYEEWLIEQNRQYNISSKIDLANIENYFLGQSNDEREAGLEERIDLLKQKLFEKTSRLGVEQLLLDRIEKTPIFWKHVFSNNLLSEDDVALKNAILLRDQLSIEFLKQNETLQQLKDQLDTHRRENFLSLLKNRQLLQFIKEDEIAMKSLRNDMRNPESIKAKEADVKKMKTRNEILRFVFQALVLESGVDWVGDEKMQQMMLTVEDV